MSSQRDYRPRLTGNPVIDEALRIAFDDIYQLRASMSEIKPIQPVKASAKTSTVSLHYKDWSGNNATTVLVTGVTIE
jgi:hypothetical protein